MIETESKTTHLVDLIQFAYRREQTELRRMTRECDCLVASMLLAATDEGHQLTDAERAIVTKVSKGELSTSEIQGDERYSDGLFFKFDDFVGTAQKQIQEKEFDGPGGGRPTLWGFIRAWLIRHSSVIGDADECGWLDDYVRGLALGGDADQGRVPSIDRAITKLDEQGRAASLIRSIAEQYPDESAELAISPAPASRQTSQPRTGSAPGSLESIAARFGALQKRFMLIIDRAAEHRAADLHQTIASAGKLMVAAIDANAFSKSREKTNKGWWSRTEHRIPGEHWTIYGQPIPPICDGKPDWDDYNKRVNGDWTSAQFDRCWRMTIGWLYESFPAYMRHAAPAWLWDRVRTDDQGRAIDRDGNVIKGRWFKGDEPMPDSFNPTPKESIGYAWRMDPMINVSECFNDEQCVAHARNICEVSADACALLSDLVGSPVEEHKNSNGKALEDATDHSEYVTADFLFGEYGIKQAAVSRNKRVRRISSFGTLDSEGKRVYVKYHLDDAIRFCSPKKRPPAARN